MYLLLCEKEEEEEDKEEEEDEDEEKEEEVKQAKGDANTDIIEVHTCTYTCKRLGNMRKDQERSIWYGREGGREGERENVCDEVRI